MPTSTLSGPDSMAVGDGRLVRYHSHDHHIPVDKGGRASVCTRPADMDNWTLSIKRIEEAWGNLCRSCDSWTIQHTLKYAPHKTIDIFEAPEGK